MMAGINYIFFTVLMTCFVLFVWSQWGLTTKRGKQRHPHFVFFVRSRIFNRNSHFLHSLDLFYLLRGGNNGNPHFVFPCVLAFSIGIFTFFF